MAKLHGVELKGIKTFRDHEGASIAQGNIYVEGKKVGEWSQDSWGGPDIISMNEGYSERAFYDAIKKVHPESKKCKSRTHEFELEYDAEILMNDLLKLNEQEKEFKQTIKKGYTHVCFVNDGRYAIRYGLRTANGITDALKSKITEAATKEGLNANSLDISFKTSLDDFIVGDPIRLADIKA